MEHASCLVCICETQEHTQSAIKNLQSAGIDMETLSIVTRELSANSRNGAHYHVGDQEFTIPGIGTVLVNGPLTSWIVAAFEGVSGAGGVSIVGEAFAALGIPHGSILEYEAALKSDRYLLMVHGSPEAVATAVNLIGGTTHSSHTVHGENVYDTEHVPQLSAKPAYPHQVR